MTAPRESLIAALADALPGSQDFSRRNAERVVEALDRYCGFAPIVADNSSNQNALGNSFGCEMVKGYKIKDPAPTTVQAQPQGAFDNAAYALGYNAALKHMKAAPEDPDVTELIEAIKDHCDPTAIENAHRGCGRTWTRFIEAYRKVRAKYE